MQLAKSTVPYISA